MASAPRARWRGLRACAVSLAPLALGGTLAFQAAPEGLTQGGWWFVALFASMLAALVLAPLPGWQVGALAVIAGGLLWPWLMPAAEQRPLAALAWALSGLQSTTVWLVFAALWLSLGYQRTGLGRRIALALLRHSGRGPLALGYAVAAIDLVMAPLIPSGTARSAGLVYPVVRSLPPLLQDACADADTLRAGRYLLWTALAAHAVSSMLFMTAMAPSLLAVDLVGRTIGVHIGWLDWFAGIAPVGLLLWLLCPLAAWALIRPRLHASGALRAWAVAESRALGPLSGTERRLLCVAVVSVTAWVALPAAAAATTALAAVAALLALRVLSWRDLVGHRPAWHTLIWFAAVVAMAGGLQKVGAIAWLAQHLGSRLAPLDADTARLLLVAAFFGLHYLFASLTAHVTALLPVMLLVGVSIPGTDPTQLALLLLYALGAMSVISPYAGGPNPVYAGSGYFAGASFWRLGALFGAGFLATLLIAVPAWLDWVLSRSWLR